MRIAIPITGTVLCEDPLTGDPDDPIRPIGLDLGHVSWVLEDVDLEDEVAVIEVTASPMIDIELPGQVDETGLQVYERRPTTPAERAAALQRVRDLILNKTKAELYELTGDTRLVKPFKGGGPPEG